VASPIAHSFAGFWIFLALVARVRTRLAAQLRQHLPQLVVLVVVANLPDFDFIPGFVLEGNANSLHRGFSHSLLAAVVISVILSCVWRIVPGLWRSALVYFTAYGSHLLIDLFTGTKLGWNNTGFGIPLFWPWSKDFTSPLILVFGVHHKTFAALLSLDNVWSCTYELLTFGAITVIILVLWKRKLRRTDPASESLDASPL
jgi:inner membrane protein